MPTHHTPHHPYAAVLRQRASRLQDLARRIDAALVTALDPELAPISADIARARLCEKLLTRNLQQLHRAADELRGTAFRFTARADELDLAARSAA